MVCRALPQPERAAERQARQNRKGVNLTIRIDDPVRRDALFGAADANLRMIRAALGVSIAARDSLVTVSGRDDAVAKAAAVFDTLQRRLRETPDLHPDDVTEAIGRAARQAGEPSAAGIEVFSPNTLVQPRTAGQAAYVQAMFENDLTVCLGPAGTGKTYLAVAVSLGLLKANRISRVALVRPAVEAGEKLGYLPGDMVAKVDPYLRPLRDAMLDMMTPEQSKRLMQNDVVEVIPLAFMRGRTLNNAAIILDEAQNTTVPQMLMFLTRLGRSSKMIVTGDDSQVDLPVGQTSGLIDAVRRLGGIPSIGIVRLEKADIVRHPLVNAVVEAYGNTGGRA